MVDFERASQRAQEFRQREQDILACAELLFLEQGEDKVTVEMIADKVGIGKGTIYKHFETKREIYLRLMIRYEESLAELLQSMGVAGDKERLVREYFMFRMQDPEKYALYDRLEEKCIAEKAMPELLDKLHDIRASNRDNLVSIVQTRIDEGILEDVPPHYHICAAWALVHGAVALRRSDFYGERVEDKSDFFEFLMDVAVRMGNRNRLKKHPDMPDDEP